MKSNLAGRRKAQAVESSTDQVIICFSFEGNPTTYTMPVPLDRVAAQAYIDTYVSHLPNYRYWLEPARSVAPRPVDDFVLAEDEQGHLSLQMGPVNAL
jgi:hypothetical protein